MNRSSSWYPDLDVCRLCIWAWPYSRFVVNFLKMLGVLKFWFFLIRIGLKILNCIKRVLKFWLSTEPKYTLHWHEVNTYSSFAQACCQQIIGVKKINLFWLWTNLTKIEIKTKKNKNWTTILQAFSQNPNSKIQIKALLFQIVRFLASFLAYIHEYNHFRWWLHIVIL